MSDPIDNEPELSDDEYQALASLLSSPDAWEAPDPSLEDSIVAAIANEQQGLSRPQLAFAPEAEPEPEPVLHIRSDDGLAEVIPISRTRRTVVTFLAGAAAAAALIFGIGFALGAEDGVTLALESTDNAPAGAAGSAEIVTTPIGTKITLDVRGLPPAEPGTYYEAWLRIDGETGVSAGTFHLRGGDGEIELWAGVLIDEYPLFTVTIQDEAEPESSGVVVLRGLATP